jgi:hypothetical protein
MNLLQESFCIGIYSIIIFWILKPGIKNTFILLFATGFVKHFLGWVSGIHAYYCKYSKKNEGKSVINIIIESIGEGFLFLFIGSLLGGISYLNIFIIGFCLHILFDMTGLHKQFCLLTVNKLHNSI